MSIYTQVSEWLAERGREHWVLAGGVPRLHLCETWREVSLKYGDESPPACGSLLALVREAWGPDFSVVLNPEGMVEIMHVPTANVVFYTADGSGGQCLAAALLAAPNRGPA